MTNTLFGFALYLPVFLFGSIVGSFLNVVIFRAPQILLSEWEKEEHPEEEEDLEIPDTFFQRLVFALRYIWTDLILSLAYIFQDFFKESYLIFKGISFPASHCGHCQKNISWYDNLPIISWFILKGKCRNCHHPYRFRYPLVELLTGLLFVFMLYIKGPEASFLFFLALVSILWCIFWIDLDTQFVFNVMTYPSILLGILYNVSIGNLKWSLVGGLIAWIMFESIMFLSICLLQKEGMGGGDVKLAIMLGIWLGPVQLMVALGIAFVLGTLVGVGLVLIKKESKPFPFGPFLVIGALVSIAVGEQLWTWYISKSIS